MKVMERMLSVISCISPIVLNVIGLSTGYSKGHSHNFSTNYSLALIFAMLLHLFSQDLI